MVAFTSHLPAFGLTPDGAADRPWARLHTTRDYITMVRIIAATEAKIVLAYSPILLEQIAAVAAGQWDEAALVTAKPTTELTADDKAYINDVFFIASPAQIDRFPRYRELADRKAQGRSLSTSDYRDVQILFNLAWTSPLLLNEEPLLSLAAKGRGFAEEDKAVLLDAHRAIANEFLASLRTLWTAGAIEVATTPLANPTLPLLVRSRMDQDSVDQIVLGAERATAVLGRAPAGMAPRAGLIDQGNDAAVHRAGYDWLLLSAEDEHLPTQLTSEDGSLLALSAMPGAGDRISDTYFAMGHDAAALDLVSSLSAAVGDTPGAVVTVSADGSEPWGRYEDGGIAFLRSLFRQLAAAPDFATALPSELNAALPFEPGPYPPLPESYLSESAELDAWAFMGETRRQLLRQREVGAVDDETLDDAYEQILQSQGSDWYWWYGTERASAEDDYYDRLFRAKLREAWDLLGAAPPSWVNVPLHDSAPVSPTRQNSPLPTTITIDNSVSDAQWARAGQFDERSSDLIRRFFYTFDETQLFIRVDFTTEVLGDSAPGFDLYLRGPSGSGLAVTPLLNGIGFDATRVVRWRGTDPVRISPPQAYPEGRATTVSPQLAGFDGNSVEFALDLAAIDPDMRPGDAIEFRIVDVTGGPERKLFPDAGRGSLELPNLPDGVELARIEDRLRDDYGPGSYSYITDSETPEGTYDLAGLAVRRIGGPSAVDPDSIGEVQFEITFREPLNNPWSAPAGFSHQTIDLYLEAYPGTETGAARLLPGRAAASEPGTGWDYAFSVDGWEGTQYTADPAGNVTELAAPLAYAVLPDRRTILVTVSRSALPEGDETRWRYGVAVLANQAIPTLGIHNLRLLSASPGRFRLGGGTGAVNDPMIIDLLHPQSGSQEEALTYPEAILLGQVESVPLDRLAYLPLLPG